MRVRRARRGHDDLGLRPAPCFSPADEPRMHTSAAIPKRARPRAPGRARDSRARCPRSRRPSSRTHRPAPRRRSQSVARRARFGRRTSPSPPRLRAPSQPRARPGRPATGSPRSAAAESASATLRRSRARRNRIKPSPGRSRTDVRIHQIMKRVGLPPAGYTLCTGGERGSHVHRSRNAASDSADRAADRVRLLGSQNKEEEYRGTFIYDYRAMDLS